MKTINSCVLLSTLLVVLVLSFAGIRSHANGCVNNNVINDFCIVSQIDAKMKNEPLLRNSYIYTTSKQGHVALIGTVEMKAQAEKILALARSIEGVKKVDITNLQIKDSKTPIIDIQILSAIDKKMKHDVLLKNIKIYAVSKRGYVGLAGSVPTQAEADRIVTLVKSIKGVKGVDITNLQVRND